MKRAQHDQPGIDEELRDLAHAADVLDAVLVGEAEVAVQPVAEVVAIERVGVPPFRVQRLLHQLGDGGLAGARQAGEPQHHRLLVVERGARRLVHQEFLGVDVGGAAQREVHHARAGGAVGEAVHQHEGAGRAVVAHRGRAARAWRARGCRSAISFSSSRLAGCCSSVLTSTRCLIVVTEAGVQRLPMRARYCRPGSIASSSIQSRCAANWSVTSGRSASGASTSPRATSTSSARQIVTASPAAAACSSPSGPRMRATRLCRPDAATTTPSPTAIAAARRRCRRSRGNPDSGGSPTAPGSGRACRPRRGRRPRSSRCAQQRRAAIPGRVAAARGHVVAEAGRDRDRRQRRGSRGRRRRSPSRRRCGRRSPRRSRPGPSCSPPARHAGCRAASR